MDYNGRHIRQKERNCDLETFRRWFDDPEVTIYLGEAYPCLSMEQEERFYNDTINEKHRYCIVSRNDGTLIGNCSFHRIDQKNRSAEVGIVIGEKAYWGQGYGREALRLLLEIGFEGLGLNRICLHHASFNERGHRAYVGAGFREEGRLRQAIFVKGRFYDDVVMAVLAEDYFRQKREQREQAQDASAEDGT